MSDMSIRPLAFVCVVFLLLGAPLFHGSAEAQSPFGPRGGEQAAPVEQQTPLISVPGPVRKVLTVVAGWQRDINRYLSLQLRDARSAGGWAAVFAVLGASFAYGVLHAGGPGHGKLVVASYFTARDAPLKIGVIMGSVIAATQAVVAIVAVSVLALVLGTRQTTIIDSTLYLEMASYGLIFGIGIWMLSNTLKGKASCGHDHAHDHDHDHDHHHHHSHGPDPAAKNTIFARGAKSFLGDYGELLAIGVVSGLRPCTGSILVLLFALANGVYWLGITAAFVMAFGVAITISALGMGAIVLRRGLAGHGDRPDRLWVSRTLSITGSLAVCAMGGLLFAGTLQIAGIVG